MIVCCAGILDLVDLGPVPERCNNSIPGINVPYSGRFIPEIELLHLSGTGPCKII